MVPKARVLPLSEPVGSRRGLHIGAAVALVAGGTAFGALYTYFGVSEILAASSEIGWGLLAFVAFMAVIVAADTGAWRVLMPGRRPTSFARLAWMRVVASSVNRLLPAAGVGGELIRARLLAKSGMAGAKAGASVVVDLTAGIMTLTLFATSGVIVLALSGVGDETAAAPIAIGLIALAGIAISFYAAQRRGLFLGLAHLLERFSTGAAWLEFTGGMRALDQAVSTLYRRRRRITLCAMLRLTAWLLGVIDIWLLFWLLGLPIALDQAFVLETALQAAIAAGFAIPGALGLAEGGMVAAAALVGVPAEAALAAALIRRVRDLLVGVPVILAWQYLEGRWLAERAGGRG